MLSTNEKVTDGFDERYGMNKSFYNMLVAYGSPDVTQYRRIPFSLLRAGDYDSSIGERAFWDERGYYWSSQVADKSEGYSIIFTLYSVNIKSFTMAKTFGFSVRCGG